ncbi:oxygenase MpaB family protein [Nocardia asteroides]|uniref:oxygenase MpaB family protein n=1 Tax=Nocardia asteroides TaxID=1824 RepID=UPI001E457DCA|nr:oxygenase MpaB family protein [Nocardia asteroides]UGT62897.1 oxygenase MpaB family protein [Nocardia asteroides]
MTRSIQPMPSTPGTEPTDRRRFIAGPGALLGGPANVIMQLSLAPVGRGVVESTVASGRFDLRPQKRGRTTLTYLAVAMLGTEEERVAYREATNTSHRQVRSQPGAEVRYNAFDPKLQLWVAGCIYLGTADSFRLLYGEQTEEFQDALYRESARFGTTLQMPAELWPADRAAFTAYWESMLPQLSIDEGVRRYLLDQVVDLGPYSRVEQLLGKRVNRFFTTGYLPQWFRDELGLDWGPRRQRVFELIMRGLGFVIQRLPEPWQRYPLDKHLADMRRRIATGKPLV